MRLLYLQGLIERFNYMFLLQLLNFLNVYNTQFSQFYRSIDKNLVYKKNSVEVTENFKYINREQH